MCFDSRKLELVSQRQKDEGIVLLLLWIVIPSAN